MEQTAVWSDMLVESTIEKTGKKDIPLKTKGHEKVRVSVCLAAKANVTCLKPFIVFGGTKPECDSLNEEFKSKAAIMTKWMDKRGVDTALCLLSYSQIFFRQSIAICGLIDCHATSSGREV